MQLLKHRDMVKKGDLWVPNPALIRAMLIRKPGENVLVVLHRDKSIIDAILGHNIVTNEGDKFYAQSACGETPTYAFDRMYLATAGPDTPAKDDDRSDFTDVAGSEKAKTAGYPKTNDDDSDNTGAGVDIISWLFSYTTGDGNWSSITHAYITIESPGVSEVLLASLKFASSWNKDSNTSAKVFVNHTQNGV
jgi:hypothetical protein